MNRREKKYKISIFTGGRGASSILASLVKINEIDLTILVNAYDDGLSTGYLRKLLPGMLGPSDIRKTFSTVLGSSGDSSKKNLSSLLEARINLPMDQGYIWRINEECINLGLENLWNGREMLEWHFSNLSKTLVESCESWIISAMNYIENRIGKHRLLSELNDMSVGNLLFIGAYLETDQDFNLTIEKWTNIFDPHATILNITNGENRVLVGLLESGSLLKCESEIVGVHNNKSKVKRVYLLEDYLSSEQIRELSSLGLDQKDKFLLNLEKIPRVNSKAKSEILESQMIVYGPGTQHSSLFPSYLTEGVFESIRDNSEAEKVFISNLNYDNDITEETHVSLVYKAYKYMSHFIDDSTNVPISKLINQVLISSSGELTSNQKQNLALDENITTLIMGDFSPDKVVHDGNRVSKTLVTLASMNSKLFPQDLFNMVSIVIPVLNEYKYIEIVLSKLVTFDWISHNIIPEIIVVDGGSTDGSWEVIKSFKWIKHIKNESLFGRGASVRLGISHASHETIVTFPADLEYEVSSIVDIAKSLTHLDLGISFGSRTTMCVDTDSRLREIYGGRTKEYFMSKWGGFLLSLISAIKFRRWVSDPLTSIKGFKSLSSMKLSLEGNSLNWDTKIIVDSWRQKIAIREIPVSFNPRTRSEGKKTTVIDGVWALWELIKPIR